EDEYMFKVPMLRNVAQTPPYFHDGSAATLPEAVAIMARVQLGLSLSEADRNDIVAFLESLTGEPPAEFLTVPVLPQAALEIPKEDGGCRLDEGHIRWIGALRKRAAMEG